MKLRTLRLGPFLAAMVAAADIAASVIPAGLRLGLMLAHRFQLTICSIFAPLYADRARVADVSAAFCKLGAAQ